MDRKERRHVEPDFQIARLERKHATLDARVNELDSHKHLTTEEELEVRALKKQKLSMKDQLEAQRAAPES
ncbi:MAG: YdcH family protein [Myxococcales bacterium]|nr:YdcH family protein [Myxococcales bacterium]